MPISQDREYRTLNLPLIVSNQEKRLASDFYIEGYATKFDKPYLLYEYDGIQYFECISKNALEGADLTDVIMQYNHRGKVLARTSNNTLGLSPDNIGLFIFADLSKGNDARNMYEEISNGLITKMSWAFTVEKESYDKSTRTRYIEKIKKVYDVSAVSLPANEDTNIKARSFAQRSFEAEQQELREREINLLKLKLNLED